MRIHTDLTSFEFGRLIFGQPKLEAVYYASWDEHGSHTHKRSFDLHLAALPGTLPNGHKRRKTNSGQYGAYLNAATYDEWGYWFAALYEADPTARCGGSVKDPVYADREDFHAKTEGKYK